MAITDVVFAVDSIPAVFAVTRDPFIVFASNAMAVLGLRALYFLLAGMMSRFRYLQAGLAVVLVLVGAKMLVSDVVHVPIWLSLLMILVVIGGSMGLSLATRIAASGLDRIAGDRARRRRLDRAAPAKMRDVGQKPDGIPAGGRGPRGHARASRCSCPARPGRLRSASWSSAAVRAAAGRRSHPSAETCSRRSPGRTSS